MTPHPLAGRPAPPELLVDVGRLERRYYDGRPDPANPAQQVSFGTSGHRGSPLDGSFTEAHILAISQAIAEYRRGRGITGPLILGKDTHAVSAPAERTALEVLAANGVTVVVQSRRWLHADARRLASHSRPQRRAATPAWRTAS